MLGSSIFPVHTTLIGCMNSVAISIAADVSFVKNSSSCLHSLLRYFSHHARQHVYGLSNFTDISARPKSHLHSKYFPRALAVNSLCALPNAKPSLKALSGMMAKPAINMIAKKHKSRKNEKGISACEGCSKTLRATRTKEARVASRMKL